MDLGDLPGLFTSPDVRVVEHGGGYYLESTTFEELEESTAVREEAQRLLRMINGAARLSSRSHRNVELGAQVEELGKNGRRQHAIVIAPPLTIRTKVPTPVVRAGGQEPGPSPPNSTVEDKLLELAAHDADVAEVLDTWGSRPHDWVNLYKVLEVIQRRADVTGNKWATPSEITLFKWTANHEQGAGRDTRHARSEGDPPPRPMTHPEAETLIERVVLAWFRSFS